MAGKPKEQTKAKRLSEALKANLRRRKEQARLRAAQAEPPSQQDVESNPRKPQG